MSQKKTATKKQALKITLTHTGEDGEIAQTWNPARLEQAIVGVAKFLASKNTHLHVTGAVFTEFAPVFGKDEEHTYTQEEVRGCATQWLMYIKDKKHAPAPLNADMSLSNICALGDRAIVKCLRTTRNGENALARALHDDASQEARAVHTGKVYTVKGDKDNRKFAGMRGAYKVACRLHAKDAWDKANKADCKDMRKKVKASVEKFILLNGKPLPKAGKKAGKKASKKAPAPKATTAPKASLTTQQIKDMAKALGASASECKTKAKATAFIASKGFSL